MEYKSGNLHGKIKELLLHIKTIFFAPLPPIQKSPQASSTHTSDKKIWTHMRITKTTKNSREKSIIHNCDLNSGVCYILIFTSEDYHEPTHSPTFRWLSRGRGEIPSKSHPRDESERHTTHTKHTHTHTHTQFWVSEIQGSSKTVPLPRSLKLCFHLFRMVGRWVTYQH